MFIQYGSVNLTMIDTNEVKREQVLTEDRTDYLYTKWTLDVNCIFSPSGAAVTYTNASRGIQAHGDPVYNPPQPGFVAGVGVGGVFPPAGVNQAGFAGSLPNLTDRAIRDYLFQPRRQLNVYDDFNGGDPFLVLQSPGTTNVPYPCDELNGPFVEAVDVVELKGVRAWWVHIRIVTYVNECSPRVSRNPEGNPILAHRWKRWVDTDTDHFAVMVSEGEVVFDPAVMILVSQWPDQYRANFFPPIDPTFRREKIEVVPSSNGCTINYRVVDRELAFSIGTNCSATRIECFQTAGYTRGSPMAGLVEGAGHVISDPLTPLSLMRPLTSLISAITPKLYDHCLIKAWGNRNSSRNEIMKLAFGIALARIGPINTMKFNEIICTQDVVGKYVELAMTYRTGPEEAFGPGIIPDQTTILSRLFGAFNGDADHNGNQNFPPVWGADDTIGIVGFDTAYTNRVTISQHASAVSGNPSPPYSNATRGTWRGKLVAQALGNPCALPLLPSDAKTNPVPQLAPFPDLAQNGMPL